MQNTYDTKQSWKIFIRKFAASEKLEIQLEGSFKYITDEIYFIFVALTQSSKQRYFYYSVCSYRSITISFRRA